MEKPMICPYCGKEMRDGAIPAYRQRLAWCPRSEEYGGIVEGDRTPLSRPTGAFGSEYADAGYCEQCKVVVVPVPEMENGTIADKVCDWLDKTLGSVGGKIDEAVERREEEKTRRKKEEKRKKDPWEV